MSGSRQDASKSTPEVTPKDFISYVRGKASDDQIQRVNRALDDPDSELHVWIRVIEKWTELAFPSTNRNDGKLPQHKEMTALNASIEFIKRKETQHILTSDQVAEIFGAGGINELATFPTTPAQALAANNRMVAKMVELQPGLAKEIEGRRTGARR